MRKPARKLRKIHRRSKSYNTKKHVTLPNLRDSLPIEQKKSFLQTKTQDKRILGSVFMQQKSIKNIHN